MDVTDSCLWTGKEEPFNKAHSHEFAEWLGEIFRTICLLDDGLLSDSQPVTVSV